MRIIAATTRIDNLRMELKDRFTTLYVPGLPVLIKFGDLPDFIKAFCQNTGVEYISQQALEILQTHDWPGNVRELKTVLNGAIILGNSKEIKADDLPTLREDRYDYRGNLDNSEKEKISDLISRSEIPPSNFFFNPWRVGKEEPTLAEIEKLTMLSRLDSISNGLRGIAGAIRKISHSEPKKHKTERIDFENTTPDEYNKLFWAHHAKEGRGGKKVAELFQERIKPTRAYENLKKAKERLNKSQGVKSDKREDIP
jgi:DNA-binding NtrC family response regulator